MAQLGRMNILVVDVGGTHVKILASGQTRAAPDRLGADAHARRQMVAGVRDARQGVEVRSPCRSAIPGRVRNHPMTEPHNLGKGWVGFDYAGAFGCPVRMVNDAAMQALGGYSGGKMLFLGFGTGLGTTLIVDGVLVPMELAHLPYRKATFEDYVGEQALERLGKKKWRKYVADVVPRLTAALEPDDIVLGGGNAQNINEMPPRSRLGSNANALSGRAPDVDRRPPHPRSRPRSGALRRKNAREESTRR